MQGVDLLDDSARELLSRFRFIPDARLDDLMVSFATDGGGVGPHVDSYDVFLLQAYGRRRWRISRQRGLRATQGSPINNVEGFRASSEWVLDAGDMLYLPPGVAHEGVALGECMTYSIGFRAPSYKQLIEPWFADYAEHTNAPGRYADSGAKASANPAALPKKMTQQIHKELARRKPRLADTERFLLRHLSEPKATTVFDAPAKTLSPAQFRRRAMRAWTDGSIAGLGSCIRTQRSESMAIGASPRVMQWPHFERWRINAPFPPIKRSARRRPLGPLLHAWYRAGWIVVSIKILRWNPNSHPKNPRARQRRNAR